MAENIVDAKKVAFDNWESFELYLEHKGVTTAITDVLLDMFVERPLPTNVYKYIYEKLGERRDSRGTERELREVNRKIDILTEEVERLSLVHDNGLKYSVYKDYINRETARRTEKLKQ